MDFDFTPDQRSVSELAAKVLASEVTEERSSAADAHADRFDADLHKTLADTGLSGIAIPEAFGGGGLGLIELCLVLQEIGRHVAPVPTLASSAFGALGVTAFGAESLKQRWLPAVASGEAILTAGFGETNRGGRSAISVTAREVDGGWQLDGSKTSVPALPIADLVLIPAQLQGSGAVGEVGVFAVPTAAPGVAVQRQRVTSGASTGSLELASVVVDDDARLRSDTNQQAIAAWIRSRAVLGVCAQQLGVLEQALAATTRYATERVQFSRPIGTFQAVVHRLADCYVDVEAVRLTLWQAAWHLASSDRGELEVEVAKFWAAEAGHRVAHAAVHVHGGMGVARSHSLHRYFLASSYHEFLLGSAVEQLLGIGAALSSDPLILERS